MFKYVQIIMDFSPVKPRDNHQMDILPQHLMISYGVLPKHWIL